jgi:bacterioferritin (cytochrome b1)
MKLRMPGNRKLMENYWKYSMSLKEIIGKMMDPEPNKRPDIESILQMNYQNVMIISSKYFEEKVKEEQEKIKEIKEKIEKVKGKEKKRKASIS